MKGKRLLIISPARINKYIGLVRQGGWKWLFMGTDPCLREKMIVYIGSETRYCYAEELQRVCKEQKQPFLNWIADIGKSQGKVWWATDIAYKSPLTSDLFLNYCFLKLIKKWEKNKDGKKIIILENPWLLKSCLISFNSSDVEVMKDKVSFVTSWIKHQFISYGRIFFFLFRAIRMYILNKAYICCYRKQTADLLKKRYDVLICTFIEDRSFKGSENRFYDPYLGTLSEYCKKKGLNVITTTLPVFPYRLLKKTYESKEIIPSIYFVKLPDIFKAFITALSFGLDKRGINSDSSFATTPILDYEALRSKVSVCYALFHYFTTLNMFKSTELSFQLSVYPFENQAWEKMMILAKREAKLECKMVGCHHIGVPFFYLNFFLGKNESAISPQPDIIVANGKHWKAVLENAGFSYAVRNGGSLRFQPSAKSVEGETSLDRNDRDKNVLVLLSTSLNYSLDLLYYLLRNSNAEKRFFIKTHPDTPERVIKKYVKCLPCNFTFVEGAMDEWMATVGWAIHIGTTAAIECMMKGIKVFKYLPERVDLDPILGLGINQPEVSDNEVIPFETVQIPDAPDNSLISETFNEVTWKEILF